MKVLSDYLRVWRVWASVKHSPRAGSPALSNDAWWDMYLFSLHEPQFHPINFKKVKDCFSFLP